MKLKTLFPLSPLLCALALSTACGKKDAAEATEEPDAAAEVHAPADPESADRGAEDDAGINNRPSREDRMRERRQRRRAAQDDQGDDSEGQVGAGEAAADGDSPVRNRRRQRPLADPADPNAAQDGPQEEAEGRGRRRGDRRPIRQDAAPDTEASARLARGMDARGAGAEAGDEAGTPGSPKEGTPSAVPADQAPADQDQGAADAVEAQKDKQADRAGAKGAPTAEEADDSKSARPSLERGRPSPLIDPARILPLARVRAITEKQDLVDGGILPGIANAQNYSSALYRPLRGTQLGVSLQTWKDSSRQNANQRFQRMKLQFPNTEAVTAIAGVEAFYAEFQEIQMLTFVDLSKQLVLTVSCDRSICSHEVLTQLAQTAKDHL